MTNNAIEDFIRTAKAETYSSGDMFFIMLSDAVSEEFISFPDTIIEKSQMIKNSASTTAGISATALINGDKVFVKRTNNKSFKFTCRYLFRPARVFRAMLGASKLEQLGITTPKVLAVGEKRKFLKLHAGYIATETSAGITGINTYIKTVNDPESFIRDFFVYAGRSLGIMHSAGVMHGDMKLCNFYIEPAAKNRFGIWDLDGIRNYTDHLAPYLAERELSHVSGTVPFIENGQGFFSTENLTRILISEYEKHIPRTLIINEGNVFSLAETRRKRMFKR